MSLNLRCVICGELIPEDRSKRGAVTCDYEHGRILKNRRRTEKSGKACRLCGRPIRKPKTERVLTEQGAIEDRVVAEGAQGIQR